MSGVYAIAECDRLESLILSVHWKYVGSTKSLRRRLDEHGPLLEQNPALRDWILTTKKEIEVWFTLIPEDKMRILERHLIRRITPKYNRIRYKKG